MASSEYAKYNRVGQRHTTESTVKTEHIKQFVRMQCALFQLQNKLLRRRGYWSVWREVYLIRIPPCTNHKRVFMYLQYL